MISPGLLAALEAERQAAVIDGDVAYADLLTEIEILSTSDLTSEQYLALYPTLDELAS